MTSDVTPDTAAAEERSPRRPVFAPRPADDLTNPVRVRRLRRRRRERLRWYVLFGIPTLILVAMGGWMLLGPSPPPAARPRSNLDVEAMVKTVDAAASTVHLTSEMLGLFGVTLFVTRDTKIEVAEGTPGSLADLREGTRVRASYDLQDGRKLARRIVIAPKDTGDAQPSVRAPVGPPPDGRP